MGHEPRLLVGDAEDSTQLIRRDSLAGIQHEEDRQEPLGVPNQDHPRSTRRFDSVPSIRLPKASTEDHRNSTGLISMPVVVKNSKKVQKQCPRCSNVVEMYLIKNEDLSFGLLAKLRADFTGMKHYFNFRLKCPICIYEEPLTVQQGYSLME
jgi:hypothetical protein